MNDQKPKIINGICEFCGISACNCQHWEGLVDASGFLLPEKDRKQKPASVEIGSIEVINVAPKKPKREDLKTGAGSLKYNKKIADIIIPHHNRHDHLLNCLNELPNDIFNIIVVSGGSFGENCNKGAKLAETDNIIILNDDVIPKVDLFLQACEMPEDIIGFYQYVPDEEKEKSGIKYNINAKGEVTAYLADTNTIPDLPTGFCMRIKTKVWKKLRGFDEQFMNGSEDHDFGFRALKLGMTFNYIKTPLVHKHSQSAGRFQCTVENRDKLHKKWPDNKIIDLLKLNEKKYNILITNNHLSNFAGSEMWTYTMAKEYERQGHNVDVYTPEPGAISDLLNYKPIDLLQEKYDLILVNHNTCLDLISDIKGFKIFTSHGIYPQLEAVADGADAYVGISQEIIDHNAKYDWHLSLIPNPVDCERFYNNKKINKKLKRVLSLCKTDEANEIIKEACDKLGIEAITCRGRFDIENAINDVDLVITLGRGAYEAMACGRPVIVFDWRHYIGKALGDGYVNKLNQNKFLLNNFSGRYSNKEIGVEELVAELKKYDVKHSAQRRSYAKKTFDAEKISKQYLSLWRESILSKKEFEFIDSSTTDYGIAKHLERALISEGWNLGDQGVSICYANDLGDITPDTQEPRTLENSFTLRRAVYSKADFIFYSQKNCEKFFTKDNCFFLPSAIDDKIFNDKELDRVYPIGFVGKIAWPIREQFINKLKGYYNERFNFQEGIYFEDVAKFYNQCELVVNHSVVNEINMRMFEATACGALLITQDVPHLSDFWEVGKEIITYRTEEEMYRLINYYLENKKEAIKIATAGQLRTLRDHNYFNRAKKIKKIICN